MPDMPGMIEVLRWDSEFFGRKMGVLSGDLGSAESVASDLELARSAGFAYLLSRPAIDDARAVRTLEQAGFYITDIGVTWHAEVQSYMRAAPGAEPPARPATMADVPRLADESV